MTKKHFEAIAASFARQVAFARKIDEPSSSETVAALRSLAEDLSTQFDIENPRFDRTKFIRACGL